jgi:hypothetical protein
MVHDPILERRRAMVRRPRPAPHHTTRRTDESVSAFSRPSSGL